MAKENASLFFLFADGNSVGASTTFSWSMANELPDTSNRDSGGYAEHLIGGGLRTTTGSCELFQDPALTLNAEELFDFLDQRSDFTAKIAKAEVGTLGFTGTATISNLEIVYEFEQPVGVSFDFQINGSWQKFTTT